jgi:hypothetical protein
MLPSLALEVKRVSSDTTLELGPVGGKISERVDLSAYASGTSFIYANEQPRPVIPLQEIQRSIYEEEPAVAMRTVQVNAAGKTLNPEYSEAGELKVTDGFNGTAQGAALTITSTAAEALGGATKLANRKGIYIMCLTGGNYFGFSAAVTPSNGIPIFQNQMMFIAASENMSVYLVRSAGTSEARIWEVG